MTGPIRVSGDLTPFRWIDEISQLEASLENAETFIGPEGGRRVKIEIPLGLTNTESNSQGEEVEKIGYRWIKHECTLNELVEKYLLLVANTDLGRKENCSSVLNVMHQLKKLDEDTSYLQGMKILDRAALAVRQLFGNLFHPNKGRLPTHLIKVIKNNLSQNNFPKESQVKILNDFKSNVNVVVKKVEYEMKLVFALQRLQAQIVLIEKKTTGVDKAAVKGALESISYDKDTSFQEKINRINVEYTIDSKLREVLINRLRSIERITEELKKLEAPVKLT